MAEVLVLKLAESIVGSLGRYVGSRIISAWNAKEDLARLESSLKLICPFIRDAERKLSSAGSNSSTDEQGNEGIENWLKELKRVIYDVEDLLDEVPTNDKKQKAAGTCFTLAGKVKALRERLDGIKHNTESIGLIARYSEPASPEASDHHHRIRFPSSSINKENFHGRKKIKRKIMKVVLRNRVEYSSHGLSAVAIVGTGGLGKTTLAQMIYSDPRIDKMFDIKLWGCVSSPFNIKSVLKRILGSIEIDTNSDDVGLMMKKIAREVRDKRYFLVLDDVWTRKREEWRQLSDVFPRHATKGSVILVTTRDHEVARTIGIEVEHRFDLEHLPFDVCMSIFRDHAFTKGDSDKFPRLKKAGKIIVERCNGLPLAVQAVGSMLRFERDEDVWDRVAGSDLWKQQPDVFAALRLSYNVLPSHLKVCFAYLSVYPKGKTLYPNTVINMWTAHGLLQPHEDEGDNAEKWQDIGERYLKELVSRSLLQEPNFAPDKTLVSFKMHGHIHQLAVDMMGEELATVSCSNNDPKVSKFVRHIILNDKDLSATEVNVPRGLLPNAHQVRTLTFAHTVPSINEKFIEHLISSFKRLRYLDLSSNNFDNLPGSIGELKHLRCLLLNYNHRLKALPESLCKLVNLQTLNLKGCDQLAKLPEDMGKLKNLTHLLITLSDQNKYFIPKRRMVLIQPSIHILCISDCMKLVSLLEEEDKGDHVSQNIRYLMKLRIMKIKNCPEFSPLLSNSLLYLTSLNRLVIQDCGKVVGRTPKLPPQPPTARVGGDMMPNGLRNLKYLRICRMTKLVSLPDVLQTAATSLRFLRLSRCDRLKSLPEWLRNFESLGHLYISDCPELSTLPSDGFRGLDSLQELEIKKCPHLSSRCSNKDYRKHWPRISHIYLDGIRINVQEESRTTQEEETTHTGDRCHSEAHGYLGLIIFAVLVMAMYWKTVVYVVKCCIWLLFFILVVRRCGY